MAPTMSGTTAATTALPHGAPAPKQAGIEAMMTPDEKLDEALKETFPASDAFWIAPQADALRLAAERGTIDQCNEPADQSS